MFFSFHHLGSVYVPKLFKGFAWLPTSGEEATARKNGGAGKAPLCSAMRPALANLGISVFVGTGFSGDGAQRCGTYSPADARDFLCTQ
jgi:hypothetical protein